MTTQQSDSSGRARPWWKFSAMWLVIGLPVIALAASVATIWIAAGTGDPIATGLTASPANDALTPAMQARNEVASRSALFDRSDRAKD